MVDRFINEAAYSKSILDGTILEVKINDYYLVMIIWNIFLLAVPFILLLTLRKYWENNGLIKKEQKIVAIFISFLWFLFLPNAAYIITDVRHLINYCPLDSFCKVCPEGAWMIIFFFVYSIIGWVAMVYSINQAKNLLELLNFKKISFLFPWFIIPYVSLGVLVGLINRWNSWDLFLSPMLVVKSAIRYFFDPIYLIDFLVFTLGFYILYWAGNRIFKKI